jgi:hypothetical protein
MRALQIGGVGFLLAYLALSLSPTMAAELKDEVAAATAAWAQALGEDDPEKVLPLYSSDAVLWGTISPKVRSNQAALRDSPPSKLCPASRSLSAIN